MANYLLETKEIVENGITYLVHTWSNGTVVRELKPKEKSGSKKNVEPTQLDRIESAVSNTLDEIRAEAVDEYTLSLMENNII